MKSLIRDSLEIFSEEVKCEQEDDEVDANLLKPEHQESYAAAVKKKVVPKMLVPFHVYRAILLKREGDYDFLTNAYMEAIPEVKEKQSVPPSETVEQPPPE